MVESSEQSYPPTDWFEIGAEDLISAKILLNARGSSTTAGMLVQQAVEKYTKGYLIGKGWDLIKTHNVEFLLVQAMKFDQQFEEYLDFGRKVSELYAADRYPARNRQKLTAEENIELIQTADGLISLITELSKEQA